MLSQLMTPNKKHLKKQSFINESQHQSTITPTRQNGLLAPGYLLTSGLKSYRMGDLTTALDLLTKYLGLIPSNLQIKWIVLDIYTKLDKLDSAWDWMEKYSVLY